MTKENRTARLRREIDVRSLCSFATRLGTVNGFELEEMSHDVYGDRERPADHPYEHTI